jgi:hypothetical protein
MKKTITIIAALVISALLAVAQPPQAFKYKAVARDRYGRLIINQTVAMRISLLQGSASGMVVFSETHLAYANAFGVIELEIGRGTFESGDFSNIDWGLIKTNPERIIPSLAPASCCRFPMPFLQAM